MAKTRRSPARQWRRVLVLGAGAAVLFLLAVGVVFARNGGTVSPTLHAAGAAPFASVEETTPPTQGTTTTTVVLLQPPIVTVPAPVTAPSTATTAGVARRTTVASAPVAKAPLLPTATLAEVWPPSRDAARVYVSGRGSDADSYVSRMTVDWGDGSVVTNLDYPLSSCHDVPSNQAADTNHGYAVPGRYTVRLIVTSVGCDGTGAQTATAETTVTYPAPSPTG